MGEMANVRFSDSRIANQNDLLRRPVRISPTTLLVPGDTHLEQKIEGVVEVTHSAEVEGKRADVALPLALTD